MIFTSKYTNLNALTTGSGKSGFFALGMAAQKKLYTVEYDPSSPGWGAPIFPLLPLPYAPAGIPPSFPEMAHSGTVSYGYLRTTGNCNMTHSRATSVTAVCSSFRRTQVHNLMNTYPKGSLWPKSQLCTREKKSP